MTFRKNFNNTSFYRASIIGWSVFIAYEVLFTYFITGKFQPFYEYFNAYLINFLLFYVNAHFLLPRYHKKPWYIIIGLVILEFLAYTLIKLILTKIYIYSGVYSGGEKTFVKDIVIQSLWRFIYFMGLSTGYWFALNIIIQRKEISDLENRKLLDQLQHQDLERKLVDSEVAYLKSQINPHFLFNTLNFLYNSAVVSAPKLGDPILLLSDIMRYALTETPQNGKVDLADEIEQINTFITLNQYRFDQNLQLHSTLTGNPAELKILPLILLTPVENIFKYADLKNPDQPAHIELSIIANQLTFRISNKKLKSRKRGIVSNGVGLKNLKLRLDVYYPEAHNLQITDNEDDYTFELELRL